MHPVPWVGLLLRRHPPGLQCQRRSWYKAVTFHRKKSCWSWKAVVGVGWKDTLPKFNIFATEHGWLEDDPFLLGWSNFQGALTVSLRECVTFRCFWEAFRSPMVDFGWVVFFGRTAFFFDGGKRQSFVPDFMWLSLLQTGESWLLVADLLTALHHLNLGTQKSDGILWSQSCWP